MALINLNDFSVELLQDLSSGDSAPVIDETEILSALSDGDFTVIRVSNESFYEKILVTNNSGVLDYERGFCVESECDEQLKNFEEGSCVKGIDGEDCFDSNVEEDCIVEIQSTDSSIIIDEPSSCSFDLSVNLDSIPSALDDLCEATEGEFLAGDFIVVVSKSGNGECSFKLVPISEVCNLVSTCQQ